MPTTYSDLLRFAKQATSENSGTWGQILNTNTLEILEDAISRVATVSATGSGDLTLSTQNGDVDQARCPVLKFTGTPTANRNVIIPALDKFYIVHNACSAAFSMIIKIGAGATVSFAQNERGIVYSDGTDVHLVARVNANGEVSNVFDNAITSTKIQDNAVVTNKINNLAVTSGKLADDSVATSKLQNLAVTDPKVNSDVYTKARQIPLNSQSTNYTFALTDAGGHVLHPASDTTPRTFTIPANSSVAFPVGSAITIVNMNGAGAITLTINSDSLALIGSSTTGTVTMQTNSLATILKVGATSWVVSGVNVV